MLKLWLSTMNQWWNWPTISMQFSDHFCKYFQRRIWNTKRKKDGNFLCHCRRNLEYFKARMQFLHKNASKPMSFSYRKTNLLTATNICKSANDCKSALIQLLDTALITRENSNTKQNYRWFCLTLSMCVLFSVVLHYFLVPDENENTDATSVIQLSTISACQLPSWRDRYISDTTILWQ